MDIDSMDLLNAIIDIHDETGVEIPEADYPLVETLDGAVRYLVAHS
jgi:acyl carrier protein